MSVAQLLYPDEYRVTKQNIRTQHIVIYILDFNLRKINELTGIALDGSSYSIDATSDIRRTCSFSIVPITADFDVSKEEWINKYVQIHIGIEDINNNNNIIYRNIGTYLINNPNKVYNATNNTINISGVDMMAKLTGMRNGYLTGSESGSQYQIPKNDSIADWILGTFELGGFKTVVLPSLYENPFQPTPLVPNDIIISVGGTIYSLLKELVEINSFYQMYFDVNGIPHVDKIPSGDNELVMVDDDLWNSVLIQYNQDISFEEVKNVVEVYGKTNDDTGVVPYAIAKEEDPRSPFNVNDIGMINIVLSGGEYDNIQTTELAQDRADYELYLRCRLQNQTTITTVPIYWLDVNWLIELTLPNKQGTPETAKYIIKKIDTNVGISGTQNITLMRYYPTDV